MEQKLPLSVEVKLLDLYNKTNLKIFNLKTLARSIDYADSSKGFVTLKNHLIKENIITPVEDIDAGNNHEKFYQIDYKKLYDFIINNSIIFNKAISCALIRHPDIQLMVKFKGIEK